VFGEHDGAQPLSSPPTFRLASIETAERQAGSLEAEFTRGSVAKRILLIDPPWYRLFGAFLPRIPIGPAYLGGVLEAAGHDVKIYMADYDVARAESGRYFSHQDTVCHTADYYDTLRDPNAPVWHEVASVIREFRPDVVGLSIMTGKYGAALNTARITKEIARDQGREILVISGGPHVSALPEEVAAEPCVDVAFKREAERSLCEWMERVDRPSEWKEVAGITFVDERGVMVDTGYMPYVARLDDLPFQARHLVHRRDTFPSHSFGYLFASRGCPYACTYCSSHDTWTRKIRYVSPERVVDEIEHSYHEYGTRSFSFEDDVFPFNRDHALAVCEDIVQRGLDIEWTCETRVNAITPEVARAIRRGGCTEVKLGVETGDEEILKWIKKKATLDQAFRAAEVLHEVGVDVATFFMVGLPDDTEETMWKSFEFMKRLGSQNICFSKATPYPGTELYDMCVSEGLLGTDLDWSAFFHQSDAIHIMKHLSRDEYHSIAMEISREVDHYNQRAWARKNVASPVKLAGKAARYLFTDPKAFLRKSASYLFAQGIERDLDTTG